jgi:hypothetical protein
MMGDFPGYFVQRPVSVTAQQTISIAGVPVSMNAVVVPANISVPYVFRGPFKIADNESPRPEDRVFCMYNFYDDLAGTGTPAQMIVQPLNGTGRVLRTISIPALAAPQIDVQRETVGFEKTLLDGSASVGLRAPVIQQHGDPTIGDDDFGDLSIIFKYALYRDCATGNLLSAGLVVTAPTGPDIPLFQTTIHPVLFQPYWGYIWNFDNTFVHGFTAVAVPTDSRDVTLLFNDVGVGYWLYRCQGQEVLTSIVPTVEVHVTTPLNHRDSQAQIRVPDIVDVTGGVHLGIGGSSIVSLGLSVPLTGPRPFNVEALAQLNWRF